MSLQIRICLYYTIWKFREDSDSEIEIIESKHHLPVKRSLTSKKQSKAKSKYVHPHSMKNTIVGLKKKENPFILMVEQSISISILYSEIFSKNTSLPLVIKEDTGYVNFAKLFNKDYSKEYDESLQSVIMSTFVCIFIIMNLSSL